MEQFQKHPQYRGTSIYT